MNYLDIIILVPVLWGIIKGFKNGLIVEVARLIALAIGIWCAAHFSGFTARILVADLGLNISQKYLSPISFAVTFVVVAIAIVLVSRMIDKFLSAIALGGINKLLGAVFGGAKFILIVAIVLFFINGLDRKINFIDDKKEQESIFYEPLIGVINSVLPNIDIDEIKKGIPEGIKKKMPKEEKDHKSGVKS